MADKVPGIYAKIATIQKEVGAIEKNGVGPSNKGSFKFIRAEDVLNTIHRLLVDNGVIVVPTIEYTKHEVVRDGGRGFINATIAVQYQYIDVDDGSSVTTSSIGEGSDIGSDTATRKAATQAMKISHLHMFTIPTDAMDDSDYGSVNPSTGEVKEAKPNRAMAKAASVKAPAASSLDALRRKVKAASVKAEVSPQDLNTMGQEIDKDFYENAESLTKLLAKLEGKDE